MEYETIKPFTTNHIIKLFTDAVGQDAFADFYNTNWAARKKEIQNLLKSNPSEKSFRRWVDIINEWTDWAKEKDYMNSWDHTSIRDFICPFYWATEFTPRNIIPTEDFVEFIVMYAICYIYKESLLSLEKYNFANNFSGNLEGCLQQFNFWMPSFNYELDLCPLEGMYKLLFELCEKKHDLIEFWNKQKEEIEGKEKCTDLRVQINRWITNKQRPTWKHIKLFLDDSLLPKDYLMTNPLEGEYEKKDLYLVFRRRIFPAYFITRFFDSLEEQELIHENTRFMIRNGIRMFYRHFLVIKTPELLEEELGNPMFCMMLKFLIKNDMGNHFNTDCAKWFKKLLF